MLGAVDEGIMVAYAEMDIHVCVIENEQNRLIEIPAEILEQDVKMMSQTFQRKILTNLQNKNQEIL